MNISRCLYSTQQLVKFNVSPDDMTWNRVTMTSDSFVCIRQRKIPPSHQQQVLFYFCLPHLQSLQLSASKSCISYGREDVFQFPWHSVACQTTMKLLCPCDSLPYITLTGVVVMLLNAEAKSVRPNAQPRCNRRLHRFL